MNKKDVVLAYSGGLDTSYCILYLIEQGYNVHAIHVNTGGFNDTEVLELESAHWRWVLHISGASIMSKIIMPNA